MSWRRLSYKITQYFAIALFLFTILLTTPWGTKLTLALLDMFDGIAIDYRSGSLIRDVQLNKLSLTLDQLEISVEGLATKVDFSCAWKKTLCIKSAAVDDFSLRYTSNANISDKNTSNKLALKTTLIEMPFAININTITAKKAHISINGTDVYANNLQTKVAIKDNQFDLLHPALKQLTIHLENSTETSLSTENNQAFMQSLHNTVAQLPDISLPLSLNIEKLKIDNITLTKKFTLNGKTPDNYSNNWQSSNNQLSASWLKSDVHIRQFSTTTEDFSVTELTADVNLTSPYKVKSKLVSNIHQLKQWPEIIGSTQQLSLQGSLENLNIELNSTASLAFNGKGQVNLVNPELPFSFSLQADKIPLPLSFAQYGKPSALSLDLSGNLQKQNLKLSSVLSSYGYNNAQVKLMTTHQHGHFSIDELLVSESDTASHLNLQGSVTALPSDFTWQLSMQSTGISLPKIHLNKLTELLQQEKISEFSLNIPESLSGRLQGKITSEGKWSNQLKYASIKDTELSGTFNDTTFKIKGDIGLTPTGHITQGGLFIGLNNSELMLKSADSSFWDLNGEIKVDNLNQWYGAIKGSVSSNFSIKGTKDNPIIHLSTDISGLNWLNFHNDNLNIAATYSPMMNHQIELALNNEQLVWANNKKIIKVTDFNFKLSGDAKQHQVNINWLGDIGGQLALTGHFDNNLTHWQSSIEKSALVYKDRFLAIEKAFALHFDFTSNTSEIANHCWQGIGVSACLLNNSTIGKSGDISVDVTTDLSLIDELFLPKEFDLISQLKGNIKTTWSEKQPLKTKADFYLSPGYIKVKDELSEYTLSQWSQGILAFTFDQAEITHKINLVDINNQALIDINAAIKLTDNLPITAQIALHQLDLQPFQSILAKVVNLQGKLTTDLAVNGTLASPLINGEIKLDQGKIKFEKNANVIDNLSTTVSIDNNKARLAGNFLLEGKEANINGQLSWQDNLAINLDLNGRALPFVFPPQLMMNMSPRLNFSFKDNTLVISGDIDVLEGNYDIEQLSEDSVPLSDDVIIIDENGEAVTKKNTNISIITNVHINIDKNFTMSGQGLQSNLLGQLQITQQEQQPLQLYGTIQSENGVFEAYGQKLKIEKGDITFNGPTDNPYINLRASKQIKTDDITVGIQVTGLADTLSMQLFSTPAMQTPEILSYLVRGRGLDSDTDNSTTAAGLLVGMSITNNIGLFEQIEKLPLINNLAVDTEGVGEQTQATVSGYVGNRVYLKYGIGVYEPINELTVRMYLFNRFWLEIVSGIEKSTDIYYSFDID